MRGGRGTRRASANEPRAPCSRQRHARRAQPAGTRGPARGPHASRRVPNARQATAPAPAGRRAPCLTPGEATGTRRRLGKAARGRGPRARPQLRRPRGPGPFAFAENGTGTAPSSHRQGRLQGDPDSRRETHHHSRVLACQGRGVGGLEAQANPWISASEGPTLQRCTTPQHGPSQSPSERGSSGAGRADENQPTLGACGEASPRGGPSTWPQVSAGAADGRQAAPPPPALRVQPTRLLVRASGLRARPFFSSARFKLITHFNFMNY